MNDVPCPDDRIAHPRVPSNPAGLAQIAYRVGDYATFRRALLRSLPNESALRAWQPTARGDLAVQLLEWWAYLADILTFYNERALSEALLPTALQSESVRRIVRLLGYRPRPGIGATGVVAALTDSPRPFVVPRGTPIQGTVGADLPPQVFEVDDDVEIGLVGQRLPSSTRLPEIPGRPSVQPTYPDRHVDGRLRDWLAARSASVGRVPAFEAGKPVVVALEGVVTNLAPDDVVVMMPRDWDGKANAAIARVEALEPTRDDQGRPSTKVTLQPGGDQPGGMVPAAVQLMKPTKTAHLWLYHDRYPGPKLPSFGSSFGQFAEQFLDPLGVFTGGVSDEPAQDAHVLTSRVELPPSDEGAAHLEGITRGIKPGDPVLFAKTGGTGTSIDGMISAIFRGDNLAKALGELQQRTFFTKVTGYDELIWYANMPEPDSIGQGPPIGPPSGGFLSGGPAPIPIPHSMLSFRDPHTVVDGMVGPDDRDIKTIVVHYAWEEVAAVVDGSTTEPTSDPEIPVTAGVPPGTPAIVEDSTGVGKPWWVGTPGVPDPDGPPLVGPLRALLNILPVSRGQTLVGETLGSGDPSIAGQEFTLARSPLTYLRDTDPGPFDGYRSTLRVRVNGIEWHEVASFFDQRPNARVFVTREDDGQRTHVLFGDGVRGARLPAGSDNVIADYRVGSGAAVPPVGALTTVLRPQPGLASIRNPIPPGGGADPDPPAQIRRYAPRSVLTFGRAVSGDDYETIAAQTPGVTRARAVWGWDGAAQRSTVRVLVGDDVAAVTAARAALRSFADPNRPVVVALATPIVADLSFTLEVERDRDPQAVSAAVSAALLDPLALPFGVEVMGIGNPIYNSEIYDVCLDVPGVLAVHGLVFRVARPLKRAARTRGIRSLSVNPQLLAALGGTAPGTEPRMTVEHSERHAPGADHYYVLRADGLHISPEVARHGH